MKDSKRLQIAFITVADAEDRRSLSGVPFYLSKLLDKYCGDVHHIHNLRPNQITVKYLLKNIFSRFTILYVVEKLKQIFWNSINKQYDWERTLTFAKYYSNIVERRLKERHYDLIFAERACVQIAFLNTEIPIIYESDATFSAMVDYYPQFSNLPPMAIKVGNMLERMSLDKARLFICLSEWAADSAERYYGVSRDKIRVISLPSFMENPPSRDGVLQEKKQNICELLFIGFDWTRKGGDIAVDTVNELIRHGINAKLNIVCGYVPARVVSSENINIVGYLDRNKSEDRRKMEELFLCAHFLILPTQAESGTANVFLDATAYGLPIVSTDTGGVSSLVHDQENGILLGVKAPGIAFAAAIKKIWEDPEKYNSMRQNARKMFEEKFTDEIWAGLMNKAIQEILSKEYGKSK